MIEKIQAKNLASGDIVYFPHAGAKKVLRLYSRYQVLTLNSISFVFDDRKTRTLHAEQKLKAEISNEAPIADLSKGELYRFDFETGRISVISSGAFLRGFDEVYSAYENINKFSRVQSTTESNALRDIECGATLYTAKAIYSQEIEKCS